MPFTNPFRRKKDKGIAKERPPAQPQKDGGLAISGRVLRQEEPLKPILTFYAQLAHGSSTVKIQDFGNVCELYSTIANAFNISVDEIAFCTLNTHKCDMDRLLGAQLGLEDFIFAHVKGEKKFVTLTKTENSLGLTITDNGNGYSFVKRLKENSIVDINKQIHVGDIVESIDDLNTVGFRHFEVAKQLKEIPVGTTFSLTLAEPKKAFDMISQRNATKSLSTNNVGSGKATLRLRSKGPATLEDLPTESENKAISKIDDLLDNFLGIRDMELSSTIWESGRDKKNPDEFITNLNEQLGDFGFPQEFIFDVWGIILDARTSNSYK